MAEHNERELTQEEVEQLGKIEHNADALAALIEDLASSSRRKRQLAARVVSLVAVREAELLAP